MELSGKKLRENNKQFKRIAAKAEIAFRKGNFHSAVAWAQICAYFAWARHPGFYCSVPLESLLLGIAKRISNEPAATSQSSSILFNNNLPNKMRILHVMTEAYAYGGHTPFIAAWIKNTKETTVHGLVTTSQRNPLPDAIASVVRSSGGYCKDLSKLSPDLLERSLMLRRLRNLADLVVVSVHPFDALPILAFGVEGGPPIVFVNHADDVFWLGTSVADIVLDLHPAGQLQTLRRRGGNASRFLPIPLMELTSKYSYESARKQIGIKPDTTILLTVGQEDKYVPIAGHDFLSIMCKVLKKHSGTTLIAIGPRHQGRWARASSFVNGRIVATGRIESSALPVYFASADIFLDSFPVGSGTAFLEAGARAIPCIGLKFKEAPSLTEAADDLAIGNPHGYPDNVEDYLSSLDQMIANPIPFKEDALNIKDQIIAHHFPPGWNRYFEDIIRQLPPRHDVRLMGALDDAGFIDSLLAELQAKKFQSETTQQTYARLMFTHANYLSRREMILEQTDNFLRSLLKINGIQGFNNSQRWYKASISPRAPHFLQPQKTTFQKRG